MHEASKWAILAILLALLSILDAAFTLCLVPYAASESNPAMEYFLSRGALYFLLAKGGLTTFGAAVMYHYRRQKLARVGLVVAVVAYLATLLYHIMLVS